MMNVLVDSISLRGLDSLGPIASGWSLTARLPLSYAFVVRG
jgi:hypothetical protein